MNTKKRRSSQIINSLLWRGGAFAVLASILVLFPMIAYGAEVDLAWDANTEPDLAGYKIYYGTASGDYSDSIDVGNVTTYTLTGLDEGVTYYLAATAYDQDGNESDYSEELVHGIFAKPGPGPKGPEGYTYVVDEGQSFHFTETVDVAYGANGQFYYKYGVTGTITFDNATFGDPIFGVVKAGFYKIFQENTLPVASFTTDKTSGEAPLTVNFDGSQSNDSDGEIVSYEWDFGDGAMHSGDTVNHTFSDPGVYTVTLTVTDDQGGTGSDTIQITASSGAGGALEITASAGANGTITPSGTVTVNHGTSRTFTISASTNYHVQDVLVDGVSVGAVTSYTFTNVTEDHTIRASFAIDTHTITAIAGANGSISPSGIVTVNHGSSRTFIISAAANYHVQDVLVNGESVGAVTSYRFTNVTQNHTIQASFAIDTHTITATTGANGSISPSDVVTVSHGSSRMFTISAADNYHVQDVLVNGESVGAVTSYRFTNVTQNHTIQASFAIDTHTITASAGKGGSISPAGSVTVNHGSDQAFTLTPAENYRIADISVDGTLVGVAPNLYRVALAYLFNNVSNNHSIHVIFAADNQPPVADAGANRAVFVHDTVQLDGSSSSDADGDNLTFNWSIVSKPGSSHTALSNTHAMKPVFDVDVAGTYRVQLIVNDGTITSAPDTVTISTENSAPVSHAGADQTVLVNDAVQLDGSASSDVDGDPLTFEWSFVSKPVDSSATLSGTTVVKPVFDVDIAGTYTVQLIVNDGSVSSVADTVTISTENSAPVSHAGADQTVLVNDTVQLDGSASSDVDGDPLTFEWSFVSKPASSSATLSGTTVVNPVFDVDVAGTYTVQLIVNDGAVGSAADTVTISTENSAPVSHAGADQAVLVDDTVQLDGSGSSDADGDSLIFNWAIVSKPAGSKAALSDTQAMKPIFGIDVAGNYTVQLIVNDGSVSSAPDTVTISTENSAPLSRAGADQTVRVDDTVQLDGSNSVDADGDTLTFKWSFISKPGGSITVLSSKITEKPSFTVDDAGTYIVQLIVNDGTDNSAPDTVTIITENSAPVSNAGDDQTVQEGETVTLSGFNSTDPDDNIASYTWQQTGGKSIALSTSKGPETTFTAPNVVTDAETLTFRLTVIDTKGLDAVDDCIVTVTRAAMVDSDGDGVSDNEDDFPYDPDESLDTDGDGEGNNADLDDDNDGMPDTWELSYGLDPLKDDAADDPDKDGILNIDEYNLGSKPNKKEDNTEPYPPALITPDNHEIAPLTPELKTDEYYDPDIDDVHSKTQWEIIRAEDEYIVLDVTTDSSLTAMTVPKMILDYDTDYVWRVKFIDNHSTASDWSEAGYFRTEFSQQDLDGNGILDDQEVGDTLDLDNDGVPDREQSDIKCIIANSGNAQIGVSIRDAENVDSILSLEIEETEDAELASNSRGKPRFIDFGLLHFKLLLNAPGEETVVTIHLSEAPFGKGKRIKRERVKMYKYDPVNAEWLDYSEYAEFSSDRKKVYLTLKDGGFGDADGIENGIIVDPLAFGSDSDSNSSSGSSSDDSLIPDNMSCFIAAASSNAGNLQQLCDWREIGTRELLIVLILIVLGYVGTEIFSRFRLKRGDEAKHIGRIAM